MLTDDDKIKGKKGVSGVDGSFFAQAAHVVSHGPANDVAAYAHSLYDCLRQFDEQDVDIIFARTVASKGIGQALMNRLLKAAGRSVLREKS